MPELPEVESVRRVLDRTLVGKKIVSAQFNDDPIVFEKRASGELRFAMEGQLVSGTGRKGKIVWLTLDGGPTVFIHLGMSGWIRALDAPSEKRLLNHGKAPLDDSLGVPRFLKLLLTAEDGLRIAFTDGRRLGRVWIGKKPENDRRVAKLGPDAFLEPPTPTELAAKLKNRNLPIKAWLMDQSKISGIGNWVADEVLYQARISPKRSAGSLGLKELDALCISISHVLEFAVKVGADETKYPKDWMFHHRWGGKRGADNIEGRKIIRESVGGRTTAWIPELQK